jgi:hypothetical protein
MGSAEEQMEEEEDKIRAAREIAYEAGVLDYCDEHDQYFDLFDDEKLEGAYRIANTKISSNDESVEVFAGKADELIELVKNVQVDLPDSCSECDDMGGPDDDEDF